MSDALDIDDGHPLALELQSLRATIAKYQHEAASASVKLQRHSLDTSHALERSRALEWENARLIEELNVLRAHPNTRPDPSALQTPQLNNALRQLSDKLSQTEELLLKRTSETLHATHELARVKHDHDAAYEIAAKARAREEDCKVRERTLLLQARNAKEESKMADLVVQEYANLVRNLTDKCPSSPQSSKSAEINHSRQLSFSKDLAQGKIGLQGLISEFSQETEKLHAEIYDLQSELELVRTQRESEHKLAEQDRQALARVQTDFDKLNLDDSTAAKMVSRYMKFSQTSNDTLQNALESLKVRHAATIATLNAQIDYFQRCLFAEKGTTERLRMALDDLTEEICRETHGRRREVSLRLACVGREENLAEHLRRWLRKAREYHRHATSLTDIEEVLDIFGRAISESDGLLDVLDRDLYLEDLPAGSLARIIAARDAAGFLSQELQVETERRMQLEKYLAHIQEQQPSFPTSTEQLSETEGPPPSHLNDADVSSENLSTDAPPVHSNVDTIPTIKLDKPLPRSPTSPIPSRPSPNLVLYHPSPVVTSPLDDVPWLDPELSGSDEAIVNVGNVDASSPTTPPPQVIVASVDPSIPSVHVSPVDPEPAPTINNHRVSPTEEVPPPADDLKGHLTPLTLTPQSVVSEIHSPISTARTPTPKVETEDPKRRELLEQLENFTSRYDGLQKAFRECHAALKELARSLLSAPQSDTVGLIRITVQRLDDFNEDTRVELEIRSADEERATQAFQTLLGVKGAITSEEEMADLEQKITAFVEGTDELISQAMRQFSQKLDDLTHDIASIKAFIHNIPDDAPEPPKPSGGWSTITASLLGQLPHSRPVSPAPTFGSVITTPRLRHAPSIPQLRKKSPTQELSDPLAELRLRIPIPSPVPTPSSPPIIRPPSRQQRIISGMHLLGFGPRGGLLGSPNASRRTSLSQAPVVDEVVEVTDVSTGTVDDIE